MGRFAVCLALLEIILQGLGSHRPALDSGVFIARGRCWLCAAVVSVSRAPGAVVAATHQGASALGVAVAVALSLAAEALDPVATAFIITFSLPCGVHSLVTT